MSPRLISDALPKTVAFENRHGQATICEGETLVSWRQWLRSLAQISALALSCTGSPQSALSYTQACITLGISTIVPREAGAEGMLKVLGWPMGRHPGLCVLAAPHMSTLRECGVSAERLH